MELFIIRHGESVGNVVVEDMPDAELTELGHQQAERVKECMKESNISHIISSPLVRAIETARPLARVLNLPIEVWKDAYEVRDIGRYVGPARQTLQQSYPEAIFTEELEAEGWIYPGNETTKMANMRATQVYEALCHRFSGQRIALFAHGGFNRHLLLAALGMEADSKVYFHQGNGCIYWLSVSAERTQLEYLGATRVIDGRGQ